MVDFEIGMPVKVRKSSIIHACRRGVIIDFHHNFGLARIEEEGTLDTFFISTNNLKLRKGVPWTDSEGWEHDGHGNVQFDLKVHDDVLLELAKLSLREDITIKALIERTIRDYAKALAWTEDLEAEEAKAFDPGTDMVWSVNAGAS